MLTDHDYQIGRFLDELEQTGQREETLVVFTSDHGLAIGSHGLMGKENLYEHSGRVPLVLSGSSVPSDRRSNAIVRHADLYPTLLELLDVEPLGGLTGDSYAPVIRGDADMHREQVCCTYRDRQRSIRDDRWKYVVYPATGHEQLFDLQSDPHELWNLLDDWRLRSNEQWGYEQPIDPSRVAAFAADLRGELREWQTDVGDPLADAKADRTGHD